MYSLLKKWKCSKLEIYFLPMINFAIVAPVNLEYMEYSHVVSQPIRLFISSIIWILYLSYEETYIPIVLRKSP